MSLLINSVGLSAILSSCVYPLFPRIIPQTNLKEMEALLKERPQVVLTNVDLLADFNVQVPPKTH